MVLTPRDADDFVDRDLVDWAWGIIANVGGGNWDRETPEWQTAAGKWRDRYHDTLHEVLDDVEKP